MIICQVLTYRSIFWSLSGIIKKQADRFEQAIPKRNRTPPHLSHYQPSDGRQATTLTEKLLLFGGPSS